MIRVEDQGTAAVVDISSPLNKQSRQGQYDCKFVVDNASGKTFQGEKEGE
jgi:hypothetical protein